MDRDAIIARLRASEDEFRARTVYSGDPVNLSDAGWAVEQAEAFVAAVRARFIP